MYKKQEHVIKHFDFVILDLLSLLVAFVLAYLCQFHKFSFIDSPSWRAAIVFACLVNLVIIMMGNTYSGILRRTGSEELLNLFIQAFTNLLLSTLILYIFKIGADYSRTVIVLMYLFYLILDLIFRMLWKSIIRSGKAGSRNDKQKSIFIIGDKSNIHKIVCQLNSNVANEYKVEGICIIDAEVDESITSDVVYTLSNGKTIKKSITCVNNCDISEITNYVLENRIDEVFVGIKPALIETETYRALVANGKGINLSIKPMIGFSTDSQMITNIGTNKALSVGVYSLTPNQIVYLAIKRFLDILFGILGVICILPLCLIIKISYLIAGDKKSIFYTQKRVGVGGKTFRLYKFRSMVHNADEILKELLKDEKYRKEWEENQKFENDPRITKLGGILRKTSLDEVPQFINILKGDMSLIGPRPLIVGELELHDGLQIYNQVKPGITGWWACNGRSNTSYDERLELEYYYIKNCSLYMDALCVIKTIAAVILKDGAK